MNCPDCGSENTRAFGGTDLYRCWVCSVIFDADEGEDYALVSLRERRNRRAMSRREQEDEY